MHILEYKHKYTHSIIIRGHFEGKGIWVGNGDKMEYTDAGVLPRLQLLVPREWGFWSVLNKYLLNAWMWHALRKMILLYLYTWVPNITLSHMKLQTFFVGQKWPKYQQFHIIQTHRENLGIIKGI